MAEILFFPGALRSGSNRRTVSGSFAPQGSSAPTQPTGQTNAVVVTRTGTGVYLFTFARPFNRLIYANFTPQLNTAAAGMFIITGTVDTQTAKTISVTYMQESAGTFAAADIAANANNRVYYEFEFSDNSSTVTP